MRSRRVLWVAVLSSVVAVAVGYWVGRARASGVPAKGSLVYSGYVTDAAGTPATGSKSIVLQVFDAETAGNMKCNVGPIGVDVGATGFFQVPLGEDCITAVRQLPDLWIEAFVGADSLGRTKLNAVPYALEAGSATAAGGALKTSLDAAAADIAALKTALATAQADVAALKTAVAAAQADLTTLKGRVDLRVYFKNGNNGTVSCDTFCAGSQWGTVGTCVSAQLSTGGIACATNPGTSASGQLYCWCSRPAI